MDEKAKRRNLTILGSSILIIGLLSVIPARWFSFDSSNSSNESSLLSVQDKFMKENINDDLDSDGLKNWEEALRGTDPKKADTDNNGISDKEEISAKEKKLSFENTTNDPTQKELNDPNNLTAQLAKNSYTISSYLNQQEITDQNTLNKISSNVLDQEISKINTKIYTSSDIKINKKDDLKTIKNYGNTLGKILLYSIAENSKNKDLDILNEYSKSNDIKILGKYDSKIKVVTSLRDELKNSLVPLSAVDSHLEALNAAELYLDVLKNFSKTGTDPLRGMIALNSYEQTMKNISDSFINMSKYFDSKNIIFTPKESGYIFTYGITN